MVGQGEATVGIVFSHDIVAAMEQGFPLQLTFPKEGTGYEIGGMALIKGGKEPVDARIFYDWALSKEAQEIGPTVKAYQAPTNPDAKPSRPELLQVKLINYDFEWSGSVKARIVEKFTQEIAAAPK
jgi:iron(III) transport system substrate-binding protein